MKAQSVEKVECNQQTNNCDKNNNFEMVYSCNFDKTDCGANPYPRFVTNHADSTFNIFQMIQTSRFLSLSDYTSVSKLILMFLFIVVVIVFIAAYLA